MPSPLAKHWTLDPNTIFLNHASFGACPTSVLQAQSEYRARLEHEPVRFFVEDLESLLDEARAALAQFLDTPPQTLAFVPNATAGVNAILHSLTFKPGDQLLTTSHAYNACANVLRHIAARTGAELVIADLPIPIESEDQTLDIILSAATPRTRLALIDHVTSPTATILPIARIIRALEDRNIDTLVDGAHAPGMLDVSINQLAPAYYTGNLHKWVCAPKGAGFLQVRADKQPGIHPAIISHGLNSTRIDRSPYLIEFDWTGTADPTPYLCVPHAIETVGAMLPGGWPAVREHNTTLARRARTLLAGQLNLTPTAPESMTAHIASLILPPPPPNAPPTPPPTSALYADPLQHTLNRGYQIQVPIIPWPPTPPTPPHPHHAQLRLTRLSAQLYNDINDYQRYADALKAILSP